MESENRKFYLVDKGEISGEHYFYGMTPKQAASKAFTFLLKRFCDERMSLSDDILRVSIYDPLKEKYYDYLCERKKLEEPIEVEIGNGDDKKTISYHYSNIVKKLNAYQNVS